MKETFKNGQASATQGFGDRLAQERREKAARDKRDIAQKDVAEAVGSSGPSVSRWEAGIGGPPSDAMIERLAAYFGVTPSWLRYGQQPRRIEQPELDVSELEVPDPRKDRKLTMQEIARAGRQAELERSAQARKARGGKGPAKRRPPGGAA